MHPYILVCTNHQVSVILRLEHAGKPLVKWNLKKSEVCPIRVDVINRKMARIIFILRRSAIKAWRCLRKSPGIIAGFLWRNAWMMLFYMYLLAIVTLFLWKQDSELEFSLHNFIQGLRSSFMLALGLATLRGLILIPLKRNKASEHDSYNDDIRSQHKIPYLYLIRRFFASALTILIFLASISEIWLSFILHTRWSDRIIRLILDTNKGESGEFLDLYLLTPKSIGVLIGFILISRAIYELLKQIGGILHISANRKLRLCQQWGICIVVLAGCYWWSLPPENNFNAENKHNTLLRLHKMVKVYERTRKNIKALEKTPVLADGFITDSADVPARIVWVIGESDSKAHWNLYGYPLPTTPRMNKLAGKGNLLKYEDVVCFEPRTYRMMEILFSPYVVTDSSKYYLRQPLTPMIMRKAGVEVRLHDNQATLVRGDDQAEVGTCNFMNSIRLSKANFDYRNDKMYPFDLQLIEAESPMLKDTRKGKSADFPNEENGKINPVLDIFHIMGQHFSAENRYPPGFGKFTAADYFNRKGLSEEEKRMVASYDNATLYVDSLLLNLYEKVKGQDAIIIYHPDHGEEMNDRRHCHVRTMDSHKTPGAAPYVLEIPFIILTTPEFRAAHPALYSRLQKASSEKQSLIYFSHFLLDVAGVTSKYHKPKFSPLSPEWCKPTRKVKDIGDYDNWKIKNKIK